jgi:tRNA threonylcarbamoyladenosine biosynthesis protein TsaE
MIWQTVTTSSAETERLGRLLGQNLKGGEVIELRSDLGGGKTTFVRGLAAGAGSKANVTSPTFTLSRIYKTKNFDIHHFDFYRLEDPGILRDQLAESIGSHQVTTVIEWADIVQDVLSDDYVSIEFKPTANDPDERQIIISYPEKLRSIITKVESEWDEIRP